MCVWVTTYFKFLIFIINCIANLIFINLHSAISIKYFVIKISDFTYFGCLNPKWYRSSIMNVLLKTHAIKRLSFAINKDYNTYNKHLLIIWSISYHILTSIKHLNVRKYWYICQSTGCNINKSEIAVKITPWFL